MSERAVNKTRKRRERTKHMRVPLSIFGLVRRHMTPLSGETAGDVLKRLLNPHGREFFIVQNRVHEEAKSALADAKENAVNEIVITREILK